MIFNSLHSQAHHGQVIVWSGAVAVGLHFGGEGVDDLAGAFEVGVAQDAEQAVVAKLLLLRVLGFVEAVGIDEKGTALDGGYLLAFVFQTGPQADGGIGLHLKEVALMVAAESCTLQYSVPRIMVMISSG